MANKRKASRRSVLTDWERRAIAAPPVLDDLDDPRLREVIRLLDRAGVDPGIKLNIYLHCLALMGDTPEMRRGYAKMMRRRRDEDTVRMLRDKLRQRGTPEHKLASEIHKAWHARPELPRPVRTTKTIRGVLKKGNF